MYLSDKLLFFSLPALGEYACPPLPPSMLICLSSISNVLKAEVVSNMSVETHLNGFELASAALRLKVSIKVNSRYMLVE